MRSSLLLVPLLAAPAAAQSVAVLEQLPNGVLFTYSDDDCNVCGGSFSPPTQTVADDFVVVTSGTFTLEEIVLWGVHDNGTALDPNVFQVTLYPDANGVPGPQIYSALLAPTSAVATGATHFGEAEVEVTLHPVPQPQLPAGTYWIELYNSTFSTPASWGWLSGDLDVANGRDGFVFSPDIPASTWYADGYAPGGPARNFALRLVGSGAQTGGPIQPYCFGASCPCANDDAAAGCTNSTGAGAALPFAGSANLAQDDLVLSGAGLPAGQPALLIVGENAVAGGAGTIFGDGLRCAGQNVRRLGVVAADAGGHASWGPGLAAGQGWLPGDVRYFQAWYRDPSGSPCGGSFNLTHGVAVTWQ
ncbi:MAG: hypothetical protein H6828_11645 [Planctomycetes bacterium]|nr:hypothetical protein [Planctomycetota bacterium]